MDFPSQDNHTMPIRPERNNVRIAISIVLGALAFGIGGYPLGIDMYQEGSSIVFLGVTFFLIAAFWGGILGLLTKNKSNVILLTAAGFIGGIACLFVANIGGLILIMLMRWLLLLTPPLFLFLIFYCFKKKDKITAAAFIMLFIYVSVDWILMSGNRLIATQFSMFALHAFIFALTGLILGYSYGWVIGKTKTMAVFGLVGLSLGSYWITILHRLFESTNNAVYGYVIAYIFLSITSGTFLVAGLFWPEKEIQSDAVICPANGIPEKPAGSEPVQ